MIECCAGSTAFQQVKRKPNKQKKTLQRICFVKMKLVTDGTIIALSECINYYKLPNR